MQNVGPEPSTERIKRAVWLLVAALGLFLAVPFARAGDTLTVAQDGTGDFTSVQAAVNTVPYYSPTRTTIYIRAGTYREKVEVPKGVNNITLVGDDRDTTVITYDDHATVNPDESVDGSIDTPTFFVKGKDFGARNITFANSAGDQGPAIAMAVHATRARFRNCAFLGYQDTLYTTGNVAYFKRCYIEGAIDFIYGSSAAVFQRCTIHPLASGFITAANTGQGKAYGLVFKGCEIKGDAPAGSVYLGRPWSDYANVVFYNCTMDDEIIPIGWDDWEYAPLDDTVLYAEYNTTGAGADPADRVDWSQQLTSQDTATYTLGEIFGLPATGSLFAPVLLATPAPWYEDY